MSGRTLSIALVCLGIATLGTGAVAAGAHGIGPLCPFGGPGGPGDPAAHIGWAVDMALDEVDATDEQSERIHAIVDGALEQAAPLHDGMAAHHAQVREVLTAESVDRTAIEAMRVDAVSRFETMSFIVADTVGDIADELTAEQRVSLADKAEEMHGR